MYYFRNKMNIKEIADALAEIKYAFTMPRLHIVNYFDDIINQVDIQCEKFLNAEVKPTFEKCEQARDNQSVIVETIKAHEKECLSIMATNDFEDNSFSEEMDARIKGIEAKLENASTWDENKKSAQTFEIEETFLEL